MKALDIAISLGVELAGSTSVDVLNVDELRGKRTKSLGFIGEDVYLKQLPQATVHMIIAEQGLDKGALDEWVSSGKERAYICIKNAYREFIKLAYKIVPASKIKLSMPSGTDSRFPGAYFGKNVTIGKDASIFPGVVVMDDCSIGDHTVLYPNVCVYSNTNIGKRVIVGAGTVIGSDGFGYVKDEDGSLLKVPHLGGVFIGDDVEIGSNTSIDRGTLGDTIIKKGTKIDNLVQVAHNCVLGENNILCGMTGLSGSTELGNNVIMGANSGTKGHIKIGDNCIVTARTSVSKDLKPGSEVKGMYPARPIAEELKIQTLVGKLPELYERIKKLEKGDK